MLNNNFIALIITFVVALAWLRVNDYAAHHNWIGSDLSRKIIHIGTGPLFVICWLLFNTDPVSRYLAALVPFAITFQFLLVGLGLIGDEAAIRAMSRTGNRREILKGPLYYGIVFVVMTILFWKDNPIGIVALMLMCGGDGMAELIGRKWGKTHLPWSKAKSWTGSLAMFFGGWILSILILIIYIITGEFSGNIMSYLLPVSIITFFATFIESLPIKDIDNITITLTAVLIGLILL
jgi:phytol kinase